MAGSNIQNFEQDYLNGQLLIAMPNLRDGCFDHSVVLMVSHDDDHALGLIINRTIADITFADILTQLDITPNANAEERSIYFGGPVETKRGMVLHSADYQSQETTRPCEGVHLTSTMQILTDINDDALSGKALAGPQKALICMGHAGWSGGQLEDEIAQNAWLNMPADPALVFDTPSNKIWSAALAKLGVQPAMLSAEWADIRDPDMPLN